MGAPHRLASPMLEGGGDFTGRSGAIDSKASEDPEDRDFLGVVPADSEGDAGVAVLVAGLYGTAGARDREAVPRSWCSQPGILLDAGRRVGIACDHSLDGREQHRLRRASARSESFQDLTPNQTYRNAWIPDCCALEPPGQT